MPSTRLVLKCFLLLAYLTVTAFLVADIINAFIVDGLTSPIPASRRPITSPTSDLTTNLASLREKILSAGLFASPREGLVKEGGSAVKGAEVAGKRVKLVGTMVATGRAPIAIVEDLVSKNNAFTGYTSKS